jgi:hypothetical protein
LLLIRANHIRDNGSSRLPAYLEMAVVSGITDSIQRHRGVCVLKEQGWTDTQLLMSLILLNIAGGDYIEVNNKGGIHD